MKNNLIHFLLMIIFCGASMAQEKEICNYTARISKADKLNFFNKSISSAPNKKTALAFIRMDRANYYRYGKRDPEDESDCYFSNIKNRAKIDEFIEKSTISEGLLKKILKDEPVIYVKVFKDKIDVAENKINSKSKRPIEDESSVSISLPLALPNEPASAPKALNKPAMPGQQTKRKVSLLDGALTEQELVSLQKNPALQNTYKKWIGRPELAICTAMIADIEQKVSNASFELSLSQWKIYSGVAAAMIFIKEYLLKTDVSELDLSTDLEEVLARDAGVSNENIYAQCYKVMLPIYEGANSD